MSFTGVVCNVILNFFQMNLFYFAHEYVKMTKNIRSQQFYTSPNSLWNLAQRKEIDCQ